MRVNLTTITMATTLCLATTLSFACETTSGAQTMALVELYTSEGCSSCPPADRWLSTFIKTNSDKAIALAFHVDYWDYLGWRDRFDSPRYSQRQHDLVAAAGGRTVYTPQLMIDGADRASWRDSSKIAALISSINHRLPGAQLTLKLDAMANQGWKAELSGMIQHTDNSQQIWIAIYEDNLSSEVRAGENSGSKLIHNRVVRGWYGPFRADNNGRIKLMQYLQPAATFNPVFDLSKAGVVAFVQDPSAAAVLQAISLPFCPHS